MYLVRLFRACMVLVGIVVSSQACAQQSAGSQSKKFNWRPIRSHSADPVPSWIDPTAIPDIDSSRPIVVRLAESQYLVDQVPIAYVRRATLINDAASLTAAGRFSISFAPEYERVQLHSIFIYRAGERLDRTSSSNIRFLRREQDLEQGD